MNFSIRQANLHDLNSITKLWEKLSFDQMSKDEYYEGSLDFSGNSMQIEDALLNPNCCIFVACNSNTIIGFMEVWTYNKDFYFFIDDYAYILHAFVEPSERSYQLITSLYKKAEEWAFSKGKQYLAADVFQHNKKVMNLLTYLGLKPYRTRLVKKLK